VGNSAQGGGAPAPSGTSGNNFMTQMLQSMQPQQATTPGLQPPPGAPGTQGAAGPQGQVASGGTVGYAAQPQSGATTSGAAPTGSTPQPLDPGMMAALAPMIQAAQQGVNENYQSTIAPNIVGQGMQSGTIGGSAQAQDWQLANYNLANSLGQVASNIYGPAFEQQQQLTSAQQIAQEQIQSQQAISQAQIAANEQMSAAQIGAQESMNTADLASNLQLAQLSAQTGLSESQLQAQVAELGLIPGLVNASQAPGQALSSAGGTLQSQLQNILNTGASNQQQSQTWPYQLLQTVSGLLGSTASLGGSGTGTGTSTTSTGK
jgi:hypothetical protein